jgi:nucleoside-diphosphate-sugar epimerase
MRISPTKGTGFIGRPLVCAMRQRGWAIDTMAVPAARKARAARDFGDGPQQQLVASGHRIG